MWAVVQVAFKKPEFLTCLSRDVGDVRRPVKVVGEKYSEISFCSTQPRKVPHSWYMKDKPDLLLWIDMT